MSDSLAAGTTTIDPYATGQIPVYAADWGASTGLAAVQTEQYAPPQPAPSQIDEGPEFASIFIPDDDEEQVLPPARGRIIALIGAVIVLLVVIYISVPTVNTLFAAGPRPTATASQTPEVTSPAPTIASIAYVDPDGSPGPDVDPKLAIDGDTETSWKSFDYPTADLSQAGPFGLVLTLAQETEVTAVSLMVYGTGGNVEIRNGTATDPDSAPVLASGPMSDSATLTFKTPVETSSLIIWFTELPTAEADGKFWIDLGEISVR